MIIVWKQARDLTAYIRSRNFAVSGVLVLMAVVICQIASQAQSVNAITTQYQSRLQLSKGGMIQSLEQSQMSRTPKLPEEGMAALTPREKEDDTAAVVSVEENDAMVNVEENDAMVNVEEDNAMVNAEEDNAMVNVEEDDAMVNVEEDDAMVNVEEDDATVNVEEDDAMVNVGDRDDSMEKVEPIQRGVTLFVDNATMAVLVPEGTTVEELLDQKEISYSGNDIITPDPTSVLADGDEIVIQRVEFEEFTQKQVIPYNTIQKSSSLIPVGVTKVAQEGENGVSVTTYLQRTIDGEQEEVQALGEEISRRPRDEVILIGAPEPISPLDFDLEVDEHGKPLQYKQLFTNQVATGYSARSGALTASGRYAEVGTVAVNPYEIPYGSKLYITSKNGEFVYGCAIAADTGIGLMQGIIDVDLFYETYGESAINGRKTVEIYVLE